MSRVHNKHPEANTKVFVDDPAMQAIGTSLESVLSILVPAMATFAALVWQASAASKYRHQQNLVTCAPSCLLDVAPVLGGACGTLHLPPGEVPNTTRTDGPPH